jgi:hypothetical protein
MNPQAPNFYSYGLNNPIRYSDPSGEVVPLLLGAWALAEIGLTAYDVYSTSEALLDEDATFGEKFRSTSFTVAGLALPGGVWKWACPCGAVSVCSFLQKLSTHPAILFRLQLTK